MRNEIQCTLYCTHKCLYMYIYFILFLDLVSGKLGKKVLFLSFSVEKVIPKLSPYKTKEPPKDLNGICQGEKLPETLQCGPQNDTPTI